MSNIFNFVKFHKTENLAELQFKLGIVTMIVEALLITIHRTKCPNKPLLPALWKLAILTPEEMNEYQQSLKIQRDNNSALSYAKKEGIEIGEHKKAVEMALKMLADNAPVDLIVKYTRLSTEEIQSL